MKVSAVVLGKKIVIMKKIVTLVSAIIMVTAANAKGVTTMPFKGTRVSVPARVRFVKGDTYAFSVEAKDTVLARSLQCSVKDSVLCFRFGNAPQAGDIKYDAKKDTYYYGVTAKEREFYGDGEQFIITVMSPELPTVRTSHDFDAVAVRLPEPVLTDEMALSVEK